MFMDKLNQIINELNLEVNITLDDIPNIDLYMDQVIQLFEKKFRETKRNKEEKVLTKTMINNYAKGKLLFPIKNKKYSKEHLLLISMIYQLKGGLSIGDIKTTLDKINQKIVKEDFHLDKFYNSYLSLCEKNSEKFTENIDESILEVKEEVKQVEDNDSNYLEQVLLIASFINMSNVYRKAAEKIVDQIAKEIK